MGVSHDKCNNETLLFPQTNFQSDETGRELLAVDELLQKHSLMESQATSIGQTRRRLNKQGEAFADNKDAQPLLKKLVKEFHLQGREGAAAAVLGKAMMVAVAENEAVAREAFFIAKYH